MTENEKQQTQLMEASFSTLVMSLGSSALINLGIVPDPNTGKPAVNREMARFNIDLLAVLKDKTKNNLSKEESEALDAILSDLRFKFVKSQS